MPVSLYRFDAVLSRNLRVFVTFRRRNGSADGPSRDESMFRQGWCWWLVKSAEEEKWRGLGQGYGSGAVIPQSMVPGCRRYFLHNSFQIFNFTKQFDFEII